MRPSGSIPSRDVEDLGAEWVERFAAPLIVRHDKEGARFFSKPSSGHVPAFPTQVVDTIGAGDSHAGGMLAGLASGWSLADAVLLGNAVASGSSDIAAVTVRRFARRYSSHTKRINRFGSS